MSSYKTIFGIDVSQPILDIMQLTNKVYSKIPNTEKAINKWISQLEDKQNTLCILEATGCYSNRLVYFLNKNNIPTIVVNPNQSSGFAKAQGIISKNDRQAAYTLALMGECLNLPLYQHPSDDMQKRKQLLMGINALVKQRQMIRNQLHALDNQIIFAPQVVQAFQQTLDTIESEIKSLEEELSELSDEEHQQQYDLITSVVGIGPKTANLLICATGGLQHFQNAKQLSKFVGLAPSSHFSGTSVRKKGAITKKGNRALRASLYMAARSAKRFNSACRDLYQRLRKAGKAHKQAMVAVMNKLIKQAFGVFKANVTFDNEFYLKKSDN